VSTTKRVLGGCVLFPVLLIASCAGKMVVDARMYELPGEVLKSQVRPTQSLDSAMQVAETLDTYVQPRFTILRDKNFGAIRIVYPKHAGIVQLKVDTPLEKELIANVNAANCDYAIGLLHCAPIPLSDRFDSANLQVLYSKGDEGAPPSEQQPSPEHPAKHGGKDKTRAETSAPDWTAIQTQASSVLPKLLAGHEHRAKDASWEILMRPVRASDRCLDCHKEAKFGSTLGVMVYAVRNCRHGDPGRIGLR
jgi:hypothetical protein